MKLITLNLWGGRACQDSQEFFDKYKDTDIWCFQEVLKDAKDYHDPSFDAPEGMIVDKELYKNLGSRLGSHVSNFCQFLKEVWGVATFFHKDIKVIEKGETLVARGDWDDMSDPHNRELHRKLQWFEVMLKGQKILLMNVHLTHRPEGKKDSEKRLNQSKMICDFMKMFDCPKILVGDFNLLPDTESIKMIEDSGMKNLVKDYGIKSTRTELYKKPIQFADYIFVSSEIKVKDFKVLPEVVSDHAALYLDFDLS
jgi:endonuclease/exonuclease/phosphatase family metal-dependent hydrolase